jgi:hypothetical protein
MDDGHFSYITKMKEKYPNVQASVFFKKTFHIEILANLNQKIAKLDEFTLEKQNFPDFSQFLCRKIAKFRQKKNTDIIIIIIIRD